MGTGTSGLSLLFILVWIVTTGFSSLSRRSGSGLAAGIYSSGINFFGVSVVCAQEGGCGRRGGRGATTGGMRAEGGERGEEASVGGGGEEGWESNCYSGKYASSTPILRSPNWGLT